MKNLLKSKLKLVKGTRFVSFAFIGCSILIAAGILFAANMYYNIDTQEVVVGQVQRVTGYLRATVGLIVGGTDTQDPEGGYVFEVVGQTKLATTTIATGELRFLGSDTYAGFKAPDSYATGTTMVYKLPQHGASPPAADYVLTFQTDAQLEWKPATQLGLVGDISDVGNVTSGAAFTSDIGQEYGSTLWFHSGSNLGALTVAGLGANATYTLPAISGTNYLTLTSGDLGTGGVLFANNGLIATSTNLYWDDASRYLRIGNSGASGELRIYSSANGYYLGFAATSTMGETTTYYWPTSDGDNNFVLTTDGEGNLNWTSVTGVGAVTGTGEAGQVTFWTGELTLDGSNNFFWSTSTNRLGIGTTSPAYALDIVGSGVQGTARLSTSLIVPLIQSTGSLTFEALGGDIILAPSTGIVRLATSTYIVTDSGYEIGIAGTEILREMIPILGFDLPVRCATTCQATSTTISRTIEDYSFISPVAGTGRVHKFVIRYADSTSTAASSTWTVFNEDTSTTTSFQVPASDSTDLAKGEVYITPAVAIPTNSNNWHLRVQVPSGVTIQIYQIFLAAYDVIQ